MPTWKAATKEWREKQAERCYVECREEESDAGLTWNRKIMGGQQLLQVNWLSWKNTNETKNTKKYILQKRYETKNWLS